MGTQKAKLLFFFCLCGGYCSCLHVPTRKQAQRASTLWSMGVKLSNRGEFRQALAILKRAEKLNPYDYWVQEAIGGTLMRMTRPKLAIKKYKRALELNPKSPRGWNNLGSAYVALKRWKKAIRAYETALSHILYQTPCYAEMNLGWAYFKDGQAQKATHQLVRATSQCPRFCQGYRLLGKVHFHQKRYAQAETAFREVTDRCQSFGPGYHALALSLLHQNKWKPMRPLLEKCQSLTKKKQPAVYRACKAILQQAPAQIKQTQPIEQPNTSYSIQVHPSRSLQRPTPASGR